MSRQEDKDAQALIAAQLYYMQDRTMESIASELRTSRSSVSRLLSHARENGIVDIRVIPPNEHGGLLERRIRDKFGVTAHVVPMVATVSEADRLDRVALMGARITSQFVDSNMVIGIAWGSTLSAVSRRLPRNEMHNTTVVQLNGAGNTQTTGVEYSSEILQRFGRAFGSVVQRFPVPAFFDDPATREAMWRERMTKRVLGMQARMDLALFGIGSPSVEAPSHVYVGGYLDEADYQSLAEDRAVGDVATVFFRADGSWRDVRLNARATGPSLDRLRRVPRRLCIVAGTHKLLALRGALAAGLITDLVLDETLAVNLVEQV
ncbi:sugar-binding transcriptional regulator [Microbacterium amylolyticum]|uniref:DNA-binding transcriptional regulator LsrR (DeoR family) n=1 Tax=Microbacterium amylolyticum TaxID=936337 RepID=A0ABS4ZFX2_9MICO|nr:sugar-binding domain-containing protein [Microbacterium amylolyticum]MBP2436176.1 DNA-binding transcriptional regulator LsrR (DeoR family) [Microbacterium amylolyticum]